MTYDLCGTMYSAWYVFTMAGKVELTVRFGPESHMPPKEVNLAQLHRIFEVSGPLTMVPGQYSL